MGFLVLKLSGKNQVGVVSMYVIEQFTGKEQKHSWKGKIVWHLWGNNVWVRLEIVKDVENVHHVSDTLKPKAVLKKK